MDSLNWEGAVGNLCAEHHHAAAVEYGIGYIAGFSTSGERLVLHGAEHLCGGHCDLSGLLGLGDHPLLSHPDLLHRDLHAQVAAGNHDAVGFRKDLVEHLDAFHILDLSDDLHLVAAILAAQLDVISGLHKAQRDVVRAVRHCPSDDIVDFTLINHWKVDFDARHIDVLLLTQSTIVHHLAHDMVLGGAHDLENNSAVLDQDGLAWLHIPRQLGVGDGNLVLIPLPGIVCQQLEALTCLQILLCVGLRESAGTNLWAPRVHKHLDGTSGLGSLLIGLLEISQLHALLLMVAMGHVAANGVHACIDEFH
mmetsp:Transcript_73141/g.117944  ORF Transcript_73141/g.117944 Transcript_73141/m.117944 type:complete len:308 (-) Transcript_73141:286-1209(-)